PGESPTSRRCRAASSGAPPGARSAGSRTLTLATDRQAQARRRALHLLLDHALRVAEGGVDGSRRQVLEHGDVAGRDQARLDADLEDAELAARHGGHHASAGRSLDTAAGQLPLELLEARLGLAGLLEQLAEIRAQRGFPSGRISRISPSR